MAKNSPDFTNYTVNVPHQAAWLVYINGLEIPVVDVDTSFGVWNIAEATLVCVPHVILQRIGFEDRLQVQIFYLDEFFDPNNPEFKLLHEYEVVGWSYTNTGTGRYIQLNCRSHVQIMEQLYFYYMSSVDDMVVANSPATATDAGVYTDTMIYYPYSLFLQGLVRPVVTVPGAIEETVGPEEFVRSPFEFISNVFRALSAPIDVTSAPGEATVGKIPANAASCPGRNFFGRWLNMTDFRRRWAGIPFFDDEQAKTEEGCFPLIKAVQSAEVLTAVQEHIGQSIGHAGSMWDLLKTVFGVMYIEIVNVPAPPAVNLQKGTGLLLGPLNTGTSGSVRNATNTFGGILSNYVKPQCIFGIPPTCNIIFPSMISSYTFQENYMHQPTRVYLGERFMSNVLTAQSAGVVQALTAEAVTTGYPLVVQNRMRMYVTDPKQNTKNFLVFPEELFKGPVSKRVSAPPWLYMLAKMQDASAEGATAEYIASSESARKASGPPRGMGKKQMIEHLKPIVAKYGGQLGIPPATVYALIQRESNFNANAVAWDGGFGLMQIQAAGSWNRGKGAKKTVDTTNTAWKLRRQKFKGPKDMPGTVFDPDNNVSMGIALLHHYAVKRQKDRGGKAANWKDLNDINLIRGILAFKFGASDGSLIWKFDYDKETDTIVINQNVKRKKNKDLVKGEEYAAATKSWRRWREAYKKWDKRDLDPPPKPKETAKKEEDTAEEKPKDKSEQDGEQKSEETKKTEEQAPAVEEEAEVPPYLEGGAQSILGSLFNLYARYEFYRTRFEHRTGGVTLSFNPYILPGYPAVVFDEKSSGFDTIGYVTNIRHKMSSTRDGPQMATTVSMSYVRSFPEFIKYLKQGFEESGMVGDRADFDCGPSEPIEAVGNAFQIQANAEKFFGDMFYPNVRKKFAPNWTPAFSWRDMINVFQADGTTPITGPEDFELEQGLVTKPTRRYFKEFRSYDAAMAYVARPVCTLRQYIELRHGNSLNNIIKSKTKVKGANLSYFSYTRSKGRGPVKGGATFWARIDAYVQGPGNPSDEAVQKATNVGPGPDFGPHPSGHWDIITAQAGIPQTRRNWDKMLRLYRSVVRGERGHIAPQL